MGKPSRSRAHTETASLDQKSWPLGTCPAQIHRVLLWPLMTIVRLWLSCTRQCTTTEAFACRRWLSAAGSNRRFQRRSAARRAPGGRLIASRNLFERASLAERHGSLFPTAGWVSTGRRLGDDFASLDLAGCSSVVHTLSTCRLEVHQRRPKSPKVLVLAETVAPLENRAEFVGPSGSWSGGRAAFTRQRSAVRTRQRPPP